jgi:hypothetical protein
VIVVAGQKRSSELKDSSDALSFMKQYLTDFDAAAKSAADAKGLENAMKQKYPGLAQENRPRTQDQNSSRPSNIWCGLQQWVYRPSGTDYS